MAAGSAGPHVIDAFKLLSEETRLAILVALWEAYDPHIEDSSVAFSKLHDSVEMRDSGNFTYHLEKLTGHFIEETAEGYRLRNAGHRIVQAVIAGTGLEERTLPPTEIEMACYRCGGPVELSFEDESLYHVCTECEGNTGPDFAEDRPVGTLMRWDFNPAGLADRTPDEIFLAGTIKALRDFGLLVRGFCPRCSGSVDASLHICGSHETSPGEACGICGTQDKMRVRYVCSVCKYGDSYPVDAVVYGHPAVVAFCYDQGIEQTFDIDDSAACGRLLKHLSEREHSLMSKDPIRIRITVPGKSADLHVTLDQELDVIDVTERVRGDDRTPSEDVTTSGLRERRHDARTASRAGSQEALVLPDTADCLQQLRRHRWPDGVTCPHCESTAVINKGTTNKDAQRYKCKGCSRKFNDLTGTIFAEHHLSIPEMFHIVGEMDETATAEIARQLDRSYRATLGFVHEVEDARESGSGSLTLVDESPA